MERSIPEPEFLWPGPAMTLLGSNGFAQGASGTFQIRPSWTGYRAGYEEAVELLLREAGNGGSDWLIYPILFSARQVLELGLKEMHELVAQAAGIDEDFQRTHDLLKLWAGIGVIRDQAGLDDEPGVEDFHRLLREFAEIDPASMRFRYPEDRDGSPSYWPDELDLPKLIDIAAVDQALQAMFNFVNGGCDFYENIVATRREI